MVCTGLWRTTWSKRSEVWPSLIRPLPRLPPQHSSGGIAPLCFNWSPGKAVATSFDDFFRAEALGDMRPIPFSFHLYGVIGSHHTCPSGQPFDWFLHIIIFTGNIYLRFCGCRLAALWRSCRMRWRLSLTKGKHLTKSGPGPSCGVLRRYAVRFSHGDVLALMPVCGPALSFVQIHTATNYFIVALFTK